MAFIDTQNLFHAAKNAFAYDFPNFDPLLLVQHVCKQQGWCEEVEPSKVHFYTGVPSYSDSPVWNQFWQAKLAHLGRSGITIVTKAVRYRNKSVVVDGVKHAIRVGEEKAIDVRLALDVIRYAYDGEYDVALIFSQDQDFAEVADEVRRIAREQRRWIKVASTFPAGPAARNARGIDHTDWIPIEKNVYDQCLDTYGQIFF